MILVVQRPFDSMQACAAAATEVGETVSLVDRGLLGLPGYRKDLQV